MHQEPRPVDRETIESHRALERPIGIDVEPLAGIEDDQWDAFIKELDASPDNLPTKPTQPAHKWPAWIQRERAKRQRAGQANSSADKATHEVERTTDWSAEFEARMVERDIAIDSLIREEERREQPDSSALGMLRAELDALCFENREGDTAALTTVEGVPSKGAPGCDSSLVAGRPLSLATVKGNPAEVAGMAIDITDDFEQLVTTCEKSWHPFASGTMAGSGNLQAPACPAPQEEAESGSASTLSGISATSTAIPACIPEHLMRWTGPAFDAYQFLRKARPLARKLSKLVVNANWQSCSGPLMAKKFPFLPNYLHHSSSKKGCSALKEEWELSHQAHPDRTIPIPEPVRPEMPAWNKRPAAGSQSPALRELVAGVRFASIAFRGQLTPQDWAHELPGSDVLCMSIDLHGEAAARFLAGEHGDVGKSLHRSLLRRLDHRGTSSDMSCAAIWTRPDAAAMDAVRVFLMLQKDDPGAVIDVELEDRNLRFWRSLLRHEVKVSPDDMPLRITKEHLAPYLGLSEQEFDQRWDEVATTWCAPVEIQEYTPEDGFAAHTELERRREMSHRKWAKFTSKLGLPAWISPAFMKRIKDYFFFTPDHARERDRLEALKDKYRYNPHKFGKPQKQALALARLKELSPGQMYIFKCSPAQFAAIAVRDGEVLGEYCDSTHKAGRAQELYEVIRAHWQPLA